MASREEILEKVRKLLAKAEAEGVTEEEALALTAKAAELMARYGIDKAMAAAREHKNENPVSIIIMVDAPYQAAKSVLLGVVARSFRCDLVRLNSRRTQGYRMHVFGFESDLEAVQVLYTSLLLQAGHGMLRIPNPHGENTRSLRQSYLLGFSNAVQGRLTSVQAEAEKSSGQPGTALVLRDRSLAVRKTLESEYSKIRTYRVSGRSVSGYKRGQDDGKNANLHNRQSTGSGSPRGELS